MDCDGISLTGIAKNITMGTARILLHCLFQNVLRYGKNKRAP